MAAERAAGLCPGVWQPDVLELDPGRWFQVLRAPGGAWGASGALVPARNLRVDLQIGRHLALESLKTVRPTPANRSSPARA